MKHFFKFLCYHFGFAITGIFAVGGNEGCTNLYVFGIWILVVCTLVTAICAKHSPYLEKRPEFIKSLTCLFHILMTFMFVWHGWFLTATAQILVFFFMEYTFIAQEKIKNKDENK